MLASWMGGAEHARGRADPGARRRRHLRHARRGGAGVHDAGQLRAQPGDALRDAPRHPGRVPARPAGARARFASLVPAEGDIALRDRVEDRARGLRHPGRAARAGGARGRGRAVAAELGYPVVLKLDSPDITHKSDVGGVALDLESADEVRAAYERIVAGARRARPEARVAG